MVDVKTEGALGQILTDGQGRTLYLFEKDSGPKSTCYGPCAGKWPPFTTSAKPKAGDGARASSLDTATRSNGTKQVVYDGHPLYYYAGDRGRSGNTKGEGLDAFGAECYALSKTGTKVEGKS